MINRIQVVKLNNEERGWCLLVDGGYGVEGQFQTAGDLAEKSLVPDGSQKMGW